ncbi:MAG: hypothetical protein KDD70_03135 [Bdellovibrionales bacterium]|nr:hypothetical protein [Bdellovibrionales bacterium]
MVDGPSDGAAGRFSIHGEFAHWSDSSPRAARERDDESLEESMVFNAAGVANRQVGIAA